jgi:hypothetical protein
LDSTRGILEGECLRSLCALSGCFLGVNGKAKNVSGRLQGIDWVGEVALRKRVGRDSAGEERFSVREDGVIGSNLLLSVETVGKGSCYTYIDVDIRVVDVETIGGLLEVDMGNPVLDGVQSQCTSHMQFVDRGLVRYQRNGLLPLGK